MDSKTYLQQHKAGSRCDLAEALETKPIYLCEELARSNVAPVLTLLSSWTCQQAYIPAISTLPDCCIAQWCTSKRLDAQPTFTPSTLEAT